MRLCSDPKMRKIDGSYLAINDQISNQQSNYILRLPISLHNIYYGNSIKGNIADYIEDTRACKQTRIGITSTSLREGNKGKGSPLITHISISLLIRRFLYKIRVQPLIPCHSDVCPSKNNFRTRPEAQTVYNFYFASIFDKLI